MTRRSVTTGPKSRSKASEKAAKKPRTDFPLYLHRGSGQWSKKVLGKTHYFGTDPGEAEKEWDRVKDDLRNGRTPDAKESDPGTLTVKWLCDSFMNSKEARYQAGKIRSRDTINDYHKVVKRFAEKIGRKTSLAKLKPRLLEDYAHNLPKTWNVTTRNNHLRQLRCVLKWANDSDELERDIKYSKALEFYQETQASEDDRQESQLSIAETHLLIAKATELGQRHLVAALWLGVNCGFTTSDLAELRKDQIDLYGGWVAMPRPKNGNKRLAALWPETIAAVQSQIENRPDPSRDEYEPLVFLTRNGRPVQRGGNKNRPMTAAFRNLKIAAGIHRLNVSQRSTRHLCRTLADGAADANAARLVMGHKIPGVERRYIDSVDKDRVKAVCDFVRDKFMTGKPKAKRTQPTKPGPR